MNNTLENLDLILGFGALLFVLLYAMCQYYTWSLGDKVLYKRRYKRGYIVYFDAKGCYAKVGKYFLYENGSGFVEKNLHTTTTSRLRNELQAEELIDKYISQNTFPQKKV